MRENKYDSPVFFEKYSRMARSQLGLAGAGGWPALQPVLPPFEGRRVLGLDTRRPCAERVLAIFAAIYAQLVRRGLPAGTSSDEQAFSQFLLKEVHELSGGEIEAMVSLAQRAAFAADTLTEEDVAAMRGWYNRIKNNKKT